MKAYMQKHNHVCAGYIKEAKTPVIMHQQAETRPFALADLTITARLDDAVIQATNLVFVKDLLFHLGVDLALRCWRSEPRLCRKDHSKRDLISPLLYVAFRLSW